MDTTGSTVLLAAAPATAYREFLYRPGGQFARWIADRFDVVARPGEPIGPALRAGDVLLEVSLGRLRPGRCTTFDVHDVQVAASLPQLAPGRLLLRPRRQVDLSGPPPVAPVVETSQDLAASARAISGATTGAALGPAGAAAGALGGAALDGLAATPQRPTAAGLASAPSPIAGGSSAAAKLLGALVCPQTLQALLSMVIGQAGAPTVGVGDLQVPVAAFANMLGALGGQAAREYDEVMYTEDGEGEAAYAVGAADPADPLMRAETLAGMLIAADAPPPTRWVGDNMTVEG
jgi:hypothetical protein